MRVVDEALTFDDVLLVPGYSDVLPREVDLSTSLTRDIDLNIPLPVINQDAVASSSGSQEGFGKMIEYAAVFSASNLRQAGTAWIAST